MAVAPELGGATVDAGALVGDACGPATVPVAVAGVGELELPGAVLVGPPGPPGGGAAVAAPDVAVAGSALFPVTARAI